MRPISQAGRTRDPRRRLRLFECVAVLSLPAVLLFFVVFATSVVGYSRAHQFDDWWSRRQSFRRVLGLKILGSANALKAVTLERAMDPEAPDPGAVRLDVSREAWDRLSVEYDIGFDQFIDASVLRGKVFHPVKVRFRGDTSVHWLTEKRSFTLKTRRSELYKGYRRLGFSSKGVLSQYVTSRLAREFDLLAPNATIAPVYLNDRFYGVFRVSELVDASFLRRHGRLPGNIYRGDTAGRGEYFKGIERGLFLNPHIWDRVASNDRPTAPPADAIERLVRDVNGTTFEDHLRLMSRLDRDEVHNLLALMLLTGDLFHMSGVHNQFWYEDPSSGLMHQIPWDIELRDLRSPPHRVNRFLRAVLRDPSVLDGALRILQAKLVGDGVLQTAERVARDIHERYEAHFAYDQLRRGAVNWVGTPDEVVAQLERNAGCIREWFDDSGVVFTCGENVEGWTILDFETTGYTGANLERIGLARGLPAGTRFELLADTNRNGRPDESDRLLSLSLRQSDDNGAVVLAEPMALPAGSDTREPLIRPAPLHYRFFLRGISSDGSASVDLPTLDPGLVNRVTGRPVVARAGTLGMPASNTTSWHPWDYSEREAREIRLSGEQELTSTLVIEAGDRLVIEPGTVLRLGADVSILARGQVIARGEADRPIEFLSQSSDRPWGCIAIMGPGASSSVFENCSFETGGGALLDGVEFKGMVSVHWAQDVRFELCAFSGNLRCDDALNAVHSGVVVDRCTFLDSNADAIDFDYSSGVIRDCRFERSGNDAIDLMSCGPRIIGNRISGSEDKGISIGERSHPLVFGNEITDCEVGIEVKDASRPWIIHDTLRDNRVGMRLAAKNWHYGGGGWGRLVHTAVFDNDVEFESDNRSRLTMTDCSIGQMVETVDSADLCDAILASHGLTGETHAPRFVGWTEVPRIDALAEDSFRDDSEDVAGGWRGCDGLRKRDGVLVVPAGGRRTRIEKSVSWNLPGNGRQAGLLVLELAADRVDRVRIEVSGPGRAVSGNVTPTGGLSRFHHVPIGLSPGSYDRVSIVLESPGSGGRMHLAGYRLYSHVESPESRAAARPADQRSTDLVVRGSEARLCQGKAAP